MNKPDQFDRPIILFGSGRCGSTALFTLMAKHHQTAWLSGIANRYPNKVAYNRHLLQLIDTPVIKQLINHRVHPGECYNFWDMYARGFRRPFRDLTADDLTIATQRKVHQAFGQILTPKRQRLLIKITGWPRLEYMQALFPNARFVYIVRDGRAVANSWLNTYFWRGWHGPDQWRWGPLPQSEQMVWEKYDRSFIALAAIQIKILMETTANSVANLPLDGRCLTIKYEDLCGQTDNTMRHILDHCQLPSTNAFNTAVARMNLSSQNGKWRKDLTPKQQDILHTILEPILQVYGYL